MTTAERIRRLANAGSPHAQIAEVLGVSLERVRSAIAHPRKRGRPPCEGTCPHCGAPPSAQRQRLLAAALTRAADRS
jgi:hypothetical protein